MTVKLVIVCFRVRYFPSDNMQNDVEAIIRRTYYRALGLRAGVEYIFEVFSAVGKENSVPVNATATTSMQEIQLRMSRLILVNFFF